MSLTVMWRSLVLVVVRLLASVAYGIVGLSRKSRVATERGLHAPGISRDLGFPPAVSTTRSGLSTTLRGLRRGDPCPAQTSPGRGGLRPKERRPPSTSSSPGTRNPMDVLSWGQACTQSMQNVQSRLPTFDGRNNANSQPRRSTRDGTASSRRPLMQSTVRHVLHVSGCRTCSSSGDIVDATKLNWPMGQRYLQKVAPVNRRSIASAAAK